MTSAQLSKRDSRAKKIFIRRAAGREHASAYCRASGGDCRNGGQIAANNLRIASKGKLQRKVPVPYRRR